MAAENLKKFLVELNDNVEKLAQFEQDPDQAMTAAGLTDEEKELVKSADQSRIIAALGEEDNVAYRYMIRMFLRFGV